MGWWERGRGDVHTAVNSFPYSGKKFVSITDKKKTYEIGYCFMQSFTEQTVPTKHYKSTIILRKKTPREK